MKERIRYFIPKAQFEQLSKKYYQRTELPLLLLSLEGEIIYSFHRCELCAKIVLDHKNILSKNCRLTMIRAVEESFRWGEGYITTCPLGLIIFSVPVINEKKLLGGFVSGFAIFPEMRKDMREEIVQNLKAYGYSLDNYELAENCLKVFPLKKVREYISYLLALARKYYVSDIGFLKARREKYIQQFKIANFLDELKKTSADVPRKILDKQEEIIQKVKLGDKTGAREILNEFLGSIFFESGMNFEILKVRIIELVVIISRAAIEAGVEAKELLGLNYSYLTELNRVTDTEELLYKLNEVLENFIHKVSTIREKKKKMKIERMMKYINQNFTAKLSAGKVARVAGLSPSRALHLFKQETGMTFSNYILKLRVDYGKYLLLNTDLNLADLASTTGFYDQSHFNKNFKKFEKMTPTQFRLKYKYKY